MASVEVESGRGAPRGGTPAHAHLPGLTMCRQVLPYSASSASICAPNALEALGKHLPAHGKVRQVCVCLPVEHPLSISTEAM